VFSPKKTDFMSSNSPFSSKKLQKDELGREQILGRLSRDFYTLRR
jgi:type I restriction-modification system DNA methylase subunit